MSAENIENIKWSDIDLNLDCLQNFKYGVFTCE